MAAAKLFVVPLAFNATAALPSKLPNASSAVTVMVVGVLPLAGTDVGLTEIVDTLLLGAAGVNVTCAVSLIDPMVAVMVSAWAFVLLNVAVNTPVESVLPAPDAGVKALLLPPPAKETACPEIGLPCASSTVTVSVVVALPLLTMSDVGLALSEQVPTAGEPGTKLTLPVTFIVPTVALKALFSAFVDESVVLHCPALLVVPDNAPVVLFDPPISRDTDWPEMGLLCASNTVTVMVLVFVPFAVTMLGLPATVEVELDGAPGTKVMVWF